MSGHFKVSRDIWEHPAFRPSEMSQREAFLWMLSEAAWKPHTRRVGGSVVELDRGQFAASTRYMAKAFQWTEARVRRYLNMLAEWEIIDAASDAGVTVVTVCNYDKYQGERRSSDAPTDAAATQQRRTTDANKKEGKQGSNTPYSPPRDKGSYSDRFEAWWKSYPRKLNASKKRASAAFERLPEAAKLQAENALSAFRRSVAKTDEQYIPHPSTWLNERRFETVSADGGDEASADVWVARLAHWASRGAWSEKWGPDPNSPDCKAPAELIRQAQERAA